MNLKASDNLSPIKNQLIHLIEPNSSVIEFGCGDGDLLLRLAPKIKSGLGIDKSSLLINKAIVQKTEKGITNLHFLCQELDSTFSNTKKFDVAVAGLFFHVVPPSDAVYLFNKLKEISKTLLIYGFSRPETLQQKALLYLDQKLTTHYKNFKAYQGQGYMEGVLAKTNSSAAERYDTEISFVKIYRVDSL